MDSNHIACFLNEFPAQKKAIEQCIRCLQDMADRIDKIHKGCTIASITANSISVSASIIGIVGLILAPTSGGGSLILTATGIGLGGAATLTTLSATLYKDAHSLKEIKKAQKLMGKCAESLRKVGLPDEPDFRSEPALSNEAMGENVKQLVSSIASQCPAVYKDVKGIKTNIKALQVARSNPALKVLAKQATAARAASQSAIKGTKQVNKAFAGTALAMTKGARMLSVASSGVFLLFDAYSIVQDAKHLIEGAKAETAAKIREKAGQLEEKLHRLENFYKEHRDMKKGLKDQKT